MFFTTEEERLNSEIWDAKEELLLAENQLDHAEPEFVDAAHLQLMAAQSRLNALIRRRKELHYDNELGIAN